MKIGENEYSFNNEVWSTSRAWGHHTEFMINGEVVSKCKLRYYNRTWESYQFRSCMRQSVHNYLDKLLEERIFEYKKEHFIKRLTQARREVVEEKFKVDYLELYELLNRI